MQWTTPRDHVQARRITSRAGTQGLRKKRTVASWSVSRDFLKQDVSLFRTTGVQEDTHGFLSGTRKHDRIEATLPTLQRRTNVVPLPSGCEEFFSRKSERTFRQADAQDSWYCSKRAPNTAIESHIMFSTTHGSQRATHPIEQSSLMLLYVKPTTLTQRSGPQIAH